MTFRFLRTQRLDPVQLSQGKKAFAARIAPVGAKAEDALQSDERALIHPFP
jgi:hypothetical protein